jgi:hypothetical protein
MDEYEKIVEKIKELEQLEDTEIMIKLLKKRMEELTEQSDLFY